jgi:hypothetical protein
VSARAVGADTDPQTVGGEAMTRDDRLQRAIELTWSHSTIRLSDLSVDGKHSRAFKYIRRLVPDATSGEVCEAYARWAVEREGGYWPDWPPDEDDPSAGAHHNRSARGTIPWAS